MSSTWGEKVKISIFGESHGRAIGVTVDGLPAGVKIDMEKFNSEMARRAPGKVIGSTPRKEGDNVNFLSGILDDTLTGTPLCMMIENTNTHSSDYGNILTSPRPSHADFTGFVRYDGFNDVRGGGHFSGRLTAPMVAVGAICKQVLESKGITIGAHILKIKDVCDESFDSAGLTGDKLASLKDYKYGVENSEVSKQMEDIIAEAQSRFDSVGAVIECGVTGIPAGLGSPMFDGIENVISSVTFGIPAVKGIEFGIGFDFADEYGSDCNDEMYYDEQGNVKTYTNNNGGILGGISNGMPIVYRVAIKPTASIGKKQRTINLSEKANTELEIKGRHDACIAVRAIPVIESACALALCEIMLDRGEI